MKCSVCDIALRKEWKFCPECGYSVGITASDQSSRAGEESFALPGWCGSGVRAQVFEVIVRQAMAGAPWREICAGPMYVNKINPEEVIEEVRRRRGGSDSSPVRARRKPEPPVGPESAAALPKSNSDRGAPAKKASATSDGSEASQASKASEGSEASQASQASKSSEGSGWLPLSDSEIEKIFTSPITATKLALPPNKKLERVKAVILKLAAGEIIDAAALKGALEGILGELDAAIRTIESQQQVLDNVEREAELRRDLDRELKRTSGPLGPSNDPGKHFFT